MNYITIKKDDLMNGEGIRVVLFVSGCHHHCPNCHNPESWDFKYGKKFDDKALEKISSELSKNYVDGITISGGDPLAPENLETVKSICEFVRYHFPKKNIWIYTGYTYEKLLEDKNPILENKLCDVLVDGPFIEKLKDLGLEYRGSSNQRIIKITDKD